MKGCFYIMIQMGTFRKIPVFRVSYGAWRDVNTRDEEKIYVVEDSVYYHDTKIARINSRGELDDFDEENFELLREHWQRKRTSEYIKRKVEQKEEEKVVAETAPQSAEPLVSETVKSAAAEDIVNDFMAHWRENIDNEIAVLKSAIAQMGVDANAVS